MELSIPYINNCLTPIHLSVRSMITVVYMGFIFYCMQHDVMRAFEKISHLGLFFLWKDGDNEYEKER